MKSRIDREKETVRQMIELYCRKKEHNLSLCKQCSELTDYAMERLSKCRFGVNKTTCRKCPVHCYKPQMREQIRQVMRWSGPRMIIYHPISALLHLVGK